MDIDCKAQRREGKLLVKGFELKVLKRKKENYLNGERAVSLYRSQILIATYSSVEQFNIRISASNARRALGLKLLYTPLSPCLFLLF